MRLYFFRLLFDEHDFALEVLNYQKRIFGLEPADVIGRLAGLNYERHYHRR